MDGASWWVQSRSIGSPHCGWLVRRQPGSAHIAGAGPTSSSTGTTAAHIGSPVIIRTQEWYHVCSGHCSFTIDCAQNVQAHMVSQKEGEGNASIREAQWGHGICPGTHDGYASGQCHKRRERGMCPSERHSRRDTESGLQHLESSVTEPQKVGTGG